MRLRCARRKLPCILLLGALCSAVATHTAPLDLDVLRPRVPADLLGKDGSELGGRNGSQPAGAPSAAGLLGQEEARRRAAGAATAAAAAWELRLARLREENDWKNDLLLFWVPQAVRARLPRLCQAWLRNYGAATAVYLGLGALWSYYIYWCFGERLFRPDTLPGYEDMGGQIKVAMAALPLYAALPALTEAVVERGWTRAYARVEEVGGVGWYLAYFVVYMACVEFFVYWSHRLLHDVRPGYRYLHRLHHMYNKEHTLSPFAGLAFHPLDGILQAFPYCFMLLVVPMHFLTHELLLFATGVWTANIHDNVPGRSEPIMGAAFHTIHHTTYKHNYGHYFIYVDWLFGTLHWPEQDSSSAVGESKKAVPAVK